ncbi:pilin [Vibrio breoganii]|uniref:Prepilin-type N-terminal cleavage/methylation domain-containing protein n=1 Tax=Vibrio breoganii TaxID=553239 RepID=A0AAJ5EK68_9VIBR|nr:pilin [Vibrio breoganii]ANO33659.1 prepilin-type N-terminal cleavage/methylation domain-containing protein [Vibrio breoganii]PMG79839.1 prepilin-type N-terminal cleavage/methylation domain-containing protein [Vibrio breoganii]PMJ46725.1 prepilin-type N-terminal cleavage/methylation domain-containing protein [Vibrio breoganii]PMK38850.1 prepilin-type N-terminal cleavage/methylation domain-containing protein [Vibrio breoganii]PMK53717.1 prepilin-type N-terminal cleavage/methylation domain-con
MSRKQTGFTLIELMIVVAIIGVLSAIGIPMYKDYVKKSELASATATLRGLLTKAELYYLDQGSFPTTLNQINTVSSAGGSIGEVGISGNQLQFTFSSTGSSLDGASVSFARDDTSGWSCSVSGAGSTVLPKGCQ